ncbi:MAG: alpha-glucosidase [Planctomycetes bacterium]|nr:alpha-glucosidase [Planctomycetota bacterium]
MTQDPKPRRERLHGGQGVPALALMPIDGGGIASVSTFVTTFHDPQGRACKVTTSRPRLLDQSEPPVPSRVLLPLDPERESLSISADQRVRFEWDGGALRAQVIVDPRANFYGGGLAAGRLIRDGRTIAFWNSDAWRYGEETPSLYQSHPFVLAILPGGRALGVLADSSTRGSLSVAPDGVEYSFEGEPFDVLVFEADDLPALYFALSQRIGRVPLPPLWSLGYHQSRWGYASQNEILELAQEFDARALPLDAVWLDIDHMQAFRVFTWDAERFPAPAEMNARLHARGLRSVAILDPGVVLDPDDPIAKGLIAGQHYVTDPRDRPVAGRVWPGMCCFPDFTRAETRAWWAETVRRHVEISGLDGLWNDMNEPSLFRTARRTLPDEALHRGQGGGTHARWHNLYGQFMAQATREGLLRARPNERPFVLTRANHLSGARFAATWTGDNQATWTDLVWSIPMVLSLGVCGQPISGPDIGGFDGDPDPELFARWFELGAYLPFARGHSEKSACRKEPWSFGPQIEAFVQAALRRRYELLPYLYTQLEFSLAAGIPLARPSFWAAPAEEWLRTCDDQFLLGDDLLVAPIVRAGETERDVLLPPTAGGWYRFPEGGAPLTEPRVRVAAPLGTTPVFARAGSIIPTVAPGLRAERTLTEAILLHAFVDPNGCARGWLYEDDGCSTGEGQTPHLLTRFELESGSGLRRTSEGSFQPPARRVDLRVHHP